MPFARNLHFTGREQQLTLLHKALTSKKPVALCGLGGVGKTQTAVEYAYRHNYEYNAILWIRADTIESLTVDIIALADLLDLPGKKEYQQRSVIAGFKHWLQTHTSWLLILDNADSIDTVSELLPLRDSGAIILTTRTQHMGKNVRKIAMEQLTREDSVSFLLQRLKFTRHPVEAGSVSELERDCAACLSA